MMNVRIHYFCKEILRFADAITAMNQPEIRRAQIRDVFFGKGVVVMEPVNLYECEIAEDCFIGPFVEIQKGVKVGARTRIQSHSFICEMVTIGADCFISHGVMFINDTFSSGKASQDKHLWLPTRIGSHVSIGTNATILPVTIGDYAVIGAGTVVTKDILEPGIYAGNPARKIRDI